MAQNISVRMDVSKIDKSKLYKGEKGTYLDAAIIMKDEPDQYGNIGMIVQSVSKEDREAGLKGAILGNVKYIGAKNQPQQAAAHEDLNSDLPF
jgi:hypothetical protein